MSKKMVTLSVTIGFVILLGVGTYIGTHKSRPGTSTHSHTSVNVRKTTYHASVSNNVFITKSNSTLGQYLTTPNGVPLYTYSKDTKGVSNCNASCLASWPAYKAATSSNIGLPLNISTISGTDNGAAQYTYKGLPLYIYAHDLGSKATGNGVDGFRLARL